MMLINCVSCSKSFLSESLPARGAVCFGCHVKTVSLGFTYGKEDFHGPTVRERQIRQVADAISGGIVAEPVPVRRILI